MLELIDFVKKTVESSSDLPVFQYPKISGNFIIMKTEISFIILL